MIVDILATCVVLRIGGNRLQPLLKGMKNKLRNRRYASGRCGRPQPTIRSS